MQVNLELDDPGDTDAYESSFESGLGTTPTSTPSSSRVINTYSSTPVGAFSYRRVHQSPSWLPAVSPQSTQTRPLQQLRPSACGSSQSGNIVGMLQEQQALLHQIINEQEEMSKSVKKTLKELPSLNLHT